MLGTDVRVHPMFWLISILMGSSTLHGGIQYLLAWVACVFISVLIHELGHVWMGQAFGSHGHIVLYGFGGLAIGSNNLPRRWQRIAVCFAGPLAGFVFVGLIFAALFIYDSQGFSFYLMVLQANLGLPIDPGAFNMEAMPRITHPLIWTTIEYLIFINLIWGLVNLLPIWPLDGGQISRDALIGASPDTGLSRSLVLSMLAAGLLAVHSLLAMLGKKLLPIPIGGSGYTALLFAVLAFQSYQLLQQAHAEERCATITGTMDNADRNYSPRRTRRAQRAEWLRMHRSTA